LTQGALTVPLSDWLGSSRQEGFSYQLQAVASRLGLEGEIADGVGYYEVWGRSAWHPLIISLEDSVLLRVLSNVRFPPGRLPPEVTVTLMERSASSRYHTWDVHNNSRWCCFYLHTRVGLPSFTAPFVKEVLEEALVEVAAVESMLTDRSYGRVGTSLELPSRRPQALPRPPEAAPLPAEAPPAYVMNLARRLLGGK
jgi:hypothetical protein